MAFCSTNSVQLVSFSRNYAIFDRGIVTIEANTLQAMPLQSVQHTKS